jgi:pimeloyl-ACP methyl ester carboxylesterase
MKRSLLVAMLAALAVAGPASAEPPRVTTMDGFAAPDTPADLNKVIVVRQGDPQADHILVLVPGTLAGAAYFAPLAKAIVHALGDWQVWSVERRENLLEDHSVLDRYLAGQATAQQALDYYLGWLANPLITDHFQPVPDSSVPFAREWGMNVAVEDLRRVVKAAGRHGRTVVLGGHSLGGSITTAYATWDFNGKPGAKGLSGLVFIDGGSLGGAPPTPEDAQASLDSLQSSSPWLDVVGLGLPWTAGVFNALGSSAAMIEPTAPSIASSFPLLPASLKPPVPVTNRAQYGYAVDTETGPSNLALVQMHIGHLAASGDPRDWEDGELGTVARAARVFAGFTGMDGTAWYHPRRLTIDAGAINNGVDNPAEAVFGDHAIHGDRATMPIYAFQTSLGYANGQNRVISAARQLAKQSHVPRREVELISKPQTYAHIDPLEATPSKNAFFKHLIPFLDGIGG